ncbi:MAG: sporulation protein YqfD [Bacilli bacterium]|nr:sporulation protein YqfD [Bacilli bacterium]
MNNKIKIKVIGKNINRFIIKLNNKKINIYEVFKKNDDCAYLVIDYKSYNDLIKYKTYYDIYIIDYLGPIKYRNKIMKNKYYLLILILAFILIFFLTRLTFNIKVITNDQEMKKLIIKELKINGISKYKFVKNYKDISKIKKNIIKKYPKLFEWLEIERRGTTYLIRYEKRLENKQKDDNTIYDIVATKDAYILALDITHGQIVKNINEYVKKGDTIVTSDVLLNDEIKGNISAKGHVYGETWYKVNINLPSNYQNKIVTNNSVNTYSLNFFSFKFLFEKTKFNDKIVLTIPKIKNNLFPISFNKEKITEVIIDTKSSEEELATNLCLDKIKSRLKDNEQILDYFILDKEKNKDGLNLTLFVSVKEEIGKLQAR